jgi:hypothetical protein
VNDFDAGFTEWMRLLPGTWFGTGSGSREIDILGGEETYCLESLADGWVRVTHRVHGGLPRWYADGATLQVAEVYVAVRYANSIRDHLGLEPIDRRELVGRESRRLSAAVIPWQGPAIPGRRPGRMEEYSADGRPVARFAYPLGEYRPEPGEPSVVAGATWYIDRPLDEVLASLRHPTGAPLFELLGDRRA